MRRDLAHASFAGKVFVPAYALPIRRSVLHRAEVRADVRADSIILSEILPGEPFDVLEVAEHRAWGQSPVDGCVGFVDLAALGATLAETTSPADPPVGDIAQIAAQLVGTPYRAGGRSATGVDSGGLVFLTLAVAGRHAPRFVDLQRRLGEPVSGRPSPGDLYFTADDVAICIDGENVVHVDPTRGVVTTRLDPSGPFGSPDAVTAIRRLA